MADSLTLKWGSIKSWDVTGNEVALEALKRYFEDPVSMSAIAQRDTPKQRQAVLDIIDAVDCPIYSDWDDKVMTKQEARDYVLNYRR